MVWKFCGNANSVRTLRFTRNFTETNLPTKFPHQEIRRNYGSLCADLGADSTLAKQICRIKWD